MKNCIRVEDSEENVANFIDHIPKSHLVVLNQIYEMEQKLKKYDDTSNIGRNLCKIKDAFEEQGIPAMDVAGNQLQMGLVYEDPMGQAFSETRTDLEATISGSETENLIVVEVFKPIIRAVFKSQSGEISKVVQKGVVVVESRKD
jgi:hypothetical protein